jgi:ankyrin repeat protein
MKAIKKKLFFSLIFLCSNVVASLNKAADQPETYVNLKDKNGIVQLLNAISKNNLGIVESLIKDGIDINLANKDGFTPLVLAAYINRLEIVESLIKAGFDLNKANEAGYTPLSYAIKNNNLEIVNALINAGVDFNKAITKTNASPLVLAAYINSLEIVESLIKAGADVNKADKDGYTPLLNAIFKNNLKIVNALINAGADVNKVSKYGLSLLIYAIGKKSKLEIIQALINAAKIILIDGRPETFQDIFTKVDIFFKKILQETLKRSSKSALEFQKNLQDKINAAQQCQSEGKCNDVKDAYNNYLANKSVA